MTAEVRERNLKMTRMLVAVIVAMFLFGFASIPLYRLFCAQLDPGGSSWFIGEPDVYEGTEVDTSRTIRVRFATNVERRLPWEFGASEYFVEVHPGQQHLMNFHAMNLSAQTVTGKAVYDINPPEAAPYFRKVECFCFIEQDLGPRESMDMPLYFWFDPDIPDTVRNVTIGYTFFNYGSSMARAMAE